MYCIMSEVEEIKCPLPPPPPPPPPPLLSKIKNANDTKIEGSCSKVTEEELDTAIRRLLSLEKNFSMVFFITNTFLTPQLQDGPKCGLVALSIASSSNDNFISVDEIYQEAVCLNYTKQGEMFHAGYLAELAQKCCKFETNIIEGGLNLHLCCIINNFLKKGLLLVPYDADHNHSPCCKEGFKAHWAVITGFAIIETINNRSNNNSESLSVTISTPNTHICRKCKANDNNNNCDISLSDDEGKLLIRKMSIRDNEKDEFLNEGKIYLIGMQGKSKHIGVWSFDEMDKSNNNLLYFSSDRDSQDYILPEGGVTKGLKGKAIMLLSKNESCS